MKRGLYLIGLCAAIGLATTGCGGSSNNGNGITNSPYKGSYVGTFTYNEASPTGEFAIYIASNGSISGRGVNIPAPNDPSTDSAQTLSGNINNSNQVTLTSNGTGGSTTYSGNLALNSTNTLLTGELGQQGAVDQMLSINEASVPSTNTFAGSYFGTFTSNNINNSLTLIVNASGAVTGLDINTTASPNTYTTVTGTVTATSATSATVSLTTTANEATVGTSTGTLTLANSTLTGSLSGSSGLPSSITLTQDTKQ